MDDKSLLEALATVLPPFVDRHGTGSPSSNDPTRTFAGDRLGDSQDRGRAPHRDVGQAQACRPGPEHVHRLWRQRRLKALRWRREGKGVRGRRGTGGAEGLKNPRGIEHGSRSGRCRPTGGNGRDGPNGALGVQRRARGAEQHCRRCTEQQQAPQIDSTGKRTMSRFDPRPRRFRHRQSDELCRNGVQNARLNVLSSHLETLDDCP